MHGRSGTPKDPYSADWFPECMRDDGSVETANLMTGAVDVSSSPSLPTGPSGLQDVQVDEEGETRFEVSTSLQNDWSDQIQSFNILTNWLNRPDLKFWRSYKLNRPDSKFKCSYKLTEQTRFKILTCLQADRTDQIWRLKVHTNWPNRPDLKFNVLTNLLNRPDSKLKHAYKLTRQTRF